MKLANLTAEDKMQLIDNSPVLSVVCDEPKGPVTRNVYKMYFTPENLKLFWEKSAKHRTLFADEINGDFKKFIEIFISQDESGNLQGHGLAWIVDDFVGVFYMTEISTTEALVHFTFSKRCFGSSCLSWISNQLLYT